MFFSIKKFNKEIQALKSLPQNDGSLHTLRQGQIKQHILERIHTETETLPVRLTRHERKRTLMQIIISILASLGLLGGTAFASVTATPGDILYPVKRAAEKVHVAVTASEEGKAELQAKHAEKRLDEFSKVKAEASVTVAADKDTKAELKTKTETETRVEVSNALKVLTEVRARLEAKHETRAAESVSKNIARLEERAKAEHIIEQTNTRIKDIQKRVETEVKNNTEPVRVEMLNGTNKIEVDSKSNSGESRVEVKVNSKTESKTNIRIDISSESKLEIK